MKSTTSYFLVLLSFVFFNTAYAGNNTTKTKKSKTETKKILKEDTQRKNGEWFLYVEDAQKASEKSGKPILANFTGSDWCGWCIRLKKEVFNTEAFLTWAKKNVILLELDYPRRKQLPDDLKAQNASLQQAFRITGYPTVYIFDLEFNKANNQFQIENYGRTGYVAGGPSKWTAVADEILNKRPKK